MEFTKEELAEFTTFNALAFDLARVNAGSTRIPCWLCTNDDSRTKYRQDMVEKFLSLGVSIEHLTLPEVDAFVDNQFGFNLVVHVEKWKKMELELKKLRDEGSPHAFFA